MKHQKKTLRIILFFLMIILLIMYLLNKRIHFFSPSNTSSTKTIHNVWINSTSKSSISIISNGNTEKFNTISPLTSDIDKHIADVTLTDNIVTNIKLKPDSISGKIINISKNSIEIEGYDNFTLHDTYTIYDSKSKFNTCSIDKIIIGNSQAELIMDNNKVCSILLTNQDDPSNTPDTPSDTTSIYNNIRVLIKNNDYSDIFHPNIELSCDTDMSIKYSNSESIHPAKMPFILNKETLSTYKENSHIVLTPTNAFSGIIINSLPRCSDSITYLGSIDILVTSNGYIIINELNIEDYLCKVIPSEMPSSFGIEALKAQAVCARTYACKHISSPGYSNYNAHLDDSTSYQVYNKQNSNVLATEAVFSTKGQVMKCDGSLINAYYFSTSSGFTSTDKQVFGNNIASPYLPVYHQNISKAISEKYIVSSNPDIPVISFESNVSSPINMPVTISSSSYVDYNSFISSKDTDCIENNCPWFRWTVSISKSDITKSINSAISNLSSSSNKNIQIYENSNLISKKIDAIGTVNEITILSRFSSGLVERLKINGKKHTVEINNQNTIRKILSPIYGVIIKNDETTVCNMTILPSAYFTISLANDVYTIHGGGFGHGTGMSQYGAMMLANNNYSYEQILNYYYEGSTIESY